MCRYSATATLASWKKTGLSGGVLLLYIMAYVSLCIVHKPQPPKMKETKCFHYMKIQQGIMPVKVTLLLLAYLRARTPTHLACCHTVR